MKLSNYLNKFATLFVASCFVLSLSAQDKTKKQRDHSTIVKEINKKISAQNLTFSVNEKAITDVPVGYINGALDASEPKGGSSPDSTFP